MVQASYKLQMHQLFALCVIHVLPIKLYTTQRISPVIQQGITNQSCHPAVGLPTA